MIVNRDNSLDVLHQLNEHTEQRKHTELHLLYNGKYLIRALQQLYLSQLSSWVQCRKQALIRYI